MPAVSPAVIVAGVISSVAIIAVASCSSTNTSGDSIATSAQPSNAMPDTAAGEVVDDDSAFESGQGSDPTTTAAPIPSSQREDVPSALRDRDNPDLPAPLVDLAEITTGGVPPDAIPALEDPDFEQVADVDWLAEREPVLALNVNDDARAYPLRIMTWHELVNGTVGGVPVTISYCPLCNSAVAYDRRVGEQILDFGTSGELYNSSLVMYDRQTESLWSHFTGQAVAGHLTGSQLDFLPIQTVRFGDFVATHPKGWVLSQDTGYARRYGFNPYVGYDAADGTPFLFRGALDDRLAPMTRVVAVRQVDSYTVVPLELLEQHRVVEFTADGVDLVALFAPGTASALDSSTISEGKDVGATGVFLRPAGLSLMEAADGIFEDSSTGATYNILGKPIGTTTAPDLTPVEHLDTFWFAVAAFDPDVEIITGLNG